MNWGMSAWKTGRGNAQKMMRKSSGNILGRRGTMISLLALGVGATVIGMVRNRNAGYPFRRLWQPIRNRIIG